MKSGCFAYRVSSDVNVLVRTELDELWLEKAGVALDLVRRRGNAGTIDDCLKVLLGVIGYTNSARLLLVQLCHCLPCINDRNIIKHLHILIGMIRALLKGEELVVRVLGLVEGDREMYEVEVEVLETELGKAVV